MTKFKSFIIIFFIMTAALSSITPLINYKTDRYRVFNSLKGEYEFYVRKDGKWEYIHNDRFIPMSYLLNQKHNYDSFIFGNSRLNNLDVSNLGNTWYKVNYNSGELSEHLHNVSLLLSSDNSNVKNIVLALDIRGFNAGVTNNSMHMDKKYLYPISHTEWFNFFYQHLFKKIDEKDIDLLLKTNYKLKNIKQHYIRTESSRRSALKGGEEHENKIKKLKSREQDFNKKNIDYNVNSIKKIKLLIEKSGATFKVILLPSHYKKFFSYNPEDINYLKKELVKITPFFDFTTPHNYIINNDFWRDLYHYTKVPGEEIIRKIQSKETICKNFGQFVTRDNIDSHLINLFETSLIAKTILEKRDQSIKFHNKYSDQKMTKSNKILNDNVLTNCKNIYHKLVLRDLTKIKDALSKYQQDNGSYPLSIGWDGLFRKSNSSGENWIVNLSPKYIKQLPRDPRKSNKKVKQYIYKSNGRDYKLISHDTQNCNYIKDKKPKLVDPKRNCWAYGFWTNGAENW